MSMYLKREMEASLTHGQIWTVLLQGHLFAQILICHVRVSNKGLDPIKGGLLFNGYMRHSYHLTVSMGLEDVIGCFCVATNVINYLLKLFPLES